MGRRRISTDSIVLVCAVLVVIIVGSVIRASQKDEVPKSSEVEKISIPLSDVHRAMTLKYATLNPNKPYEDAVLVLFENGSYRIASPGEDHYGSYVVTRSDPQLSITFISWPSRDWAIDSASNVAMHELRLYPAGSFIQELTVPGGEKSTQSGRWRDITNPEQLKSSKGWEDLKKHIS